MASHVDSETIVAAQEPSNDSKLVDENANFVGESVPERADVKASVDALQLLKAEMALAEKVGIDGDCKYKEPLKNLREESEKTPESAKHAADIDEVRVPTPYPKTLLESIHSGESLEDDVLVEDSLPSGDNVAGQEKASTAVSSGIEGTSEISDTPLTDAREDNDAENETYTVSTSLAAGGSKKKRTRVRTGSHKARNNRSSTSDRRDKSVNYNGRLGSTTSTGVGNDPFVPRDLMSQRFARVPFDPNRSRYYHGQGYNGNYMGNQGYYESYRGAGRGRYFNNRGYHGFNGHYNHSVHEYHRNYSGNRATTIVNAPFAAPGNGVYRGRERSTSQPVQPETDRYDEVVNSINYNDNGRVINVKAFLSPSAAAKLKEQSAYNLRVRLPATTPLSVVKRILCAKFYLTKMMSAAKYSTDRSAEFYQEGGSIFMENRHRRTDLMCELVVDQFQLSCANHPNVFLSESETLHSMLYRHPFLQRATPVGGEVCFSLR